MFRRLPALSSLANTLNWLLLLSAILFSLTPAAFAGTVTLAWDPVDDPRLDGYRLYYGDESRNYKSNIEVGNQTTYTVSDLTDGNTYYFTVTAVGANGQPESAFSNEVTYTVPTTVPTPVALDADFTATPTSGPAPLTVKFTDTSSGSVNTWAWDFGDGNSSTAQTAVTTYSDPGTYTVKLDVADAAGNSDTITKADYISVAPSGGDPAPDPDPEPEPEPEPEPSPDPEPSSLGLVTAFDFEELQGNQVDDSSGQANHGLISGATRNEQGRFGRSLTFDGTNDWVKVNDAASLDLTTGMTIELWVYPTNRMRGWRCPLLKEKSNGLVYSLCANNDANRPSTAVHVNGDQNLAGGSRLPRNRWTHLAATYDGTTQRLFVNGRQVASEPLSGSIQTSDGPLYIGGNSVYGEFFKGRIDEVRVYDRALTESEIQTDMETPVVGNPTDPPPDDTNPGVCATPCSLWDNAATPSVLQDPDTSPVELGVKFQSDVDGLITGIRFYKSSQNTGTHVGSLWASDGTLLAEATFTDETDSGWQQVAFSTPVPIAAGTVYTASYHTEVGRYSVDEGYFASTHTNGPLSAPSDTESGGNGVYLYGNGGFPSNTYRASNYWVDVLFKTQ